MLLVMVSREQTEPKLTLVRKEPPPARILPAIPIAHKGGALLARGPRNREAADFHIPVACFTQASRHLHRALDIEKQQCFSEINQKIYICLLLVSCRPAATCKDSLGSSHPTQRKIRAYTWP
jgi:hypothetical protein